ncbi:flagella assembly protein FlgT [Idiomarina xiamenensis]|uniref:Lipoprotein n=1 Tax=Idiomarina xiamenensis 10-D-4 TaxID=740709 RepID=K2K366_9GAMM|nr:flagella assembly protein FlgT [Idiomarina xiamenensis]EKE82068.1 hypothetical protein A10D4_09834 [Idiomarina xiamenensis 10-D-4]
MRVVTLAFFISLAAIGLPAQARWIEAQGQAPIINGNVSDARAKAIENAIQQSLMAAGGEVSSVQQIVDGVLQNTQVQWRGQGNVDQVDIVSEEVRDNRIYITVRADIWQRDKQCQASEYRKSVTVAPFELARREQANYGDIYAIGEVAAERFARDLSSGNSHLLVKHTLQRPVGLDEALQQLSLQQLGEIARRVGEHNDSQYVITAIFDDLSVASERGWLSTWSNPQRHFALTFYLLDAYSGETITRARISENAEWTYARNAKVDVAADQFWREPFGAVLAQNMQDVVQGFDAKLRCQETRGRIVQVDAQTIQINIGRVNGVKTGDQLKVVQEANFIDQQGHYRQKWHVSDYTAVVQQVNDTTAVATIGNAGFLGNVQIDDWVVPVIKR